MIQSSDNKTQRIGFEWAGRNVACKSRYSCMNLISPALAGSSVCPRLQPAGWGTKWRVGSAGLSRSFREGFSQDVRSGNG